MSEAEALSLLVQNIYDAALDPSLWPAALRRTASFVGGSGASVYTKDTVKRDVSIYYDDGSLDLDWVHLYADKYVRLDPSTTRHFLLNVEESAATIDFMPYSEFQDTRFYAEWAQPQHLVDALTSMLEKSGSRLGMLTVFRDQGDGLVDAKARQRMQLVVPHVRRAVLVAGLMQEQNGLTVSLADALDALHASVFLLNGDRQIVHTNAAGRALLASSTLLTVASDRLTGLTPEVDRMLSAGLALVGTGAGLVGEGTVMAVSGRDGELYVAHTVPLGAAAREAGTGTAAAVALFIRHATLGSLSAPGALAEAYALTPTELRVLLAVVEIGGGPEVADALGVAETTVKFHLRGLFEKTGMHRQADLVKLVAGFSVP